MPSILLVVNAIISHFNETHPKGLLAAQDHCNGWPLIQSFSTCPSTFEEWVFDMWQVLDMYSPACYVYLAPIYTNSSFKDLQSINHSYQPMKYCIWFTDCFKLLTDILPTTSTCCKITRNNC